MTETTNSMLIDMFNRWKTANLSRLEHWQLRIHLTEADLNILKTLEGDTSKNKYFEEITMPYI